MLNIQIVMGRLVSDPDVREMSNGSKRCTFTLASQDDVPKADGERDTDFVDCIAWNSKAEFIGKHCAKGRLIEVEGRPKTRKYQDNNNVTHKVTELRVSNIWLLDRKPTAEAEQPPREADDSDDEIPF